MLIAQVTDLHIGFDIADPWEDNVHRLRAVLNELAHGPNRPDLVLLSGDLTNGGQPDSYARLADLLGQFDLSYHLMVGNHDKRETFIAQFSQVPVEDGFVQYEVRLPGLRLILLDTVEPGRHGGAFCEARAAWLAAKLDADPATPVLIAMHHPPIVSGIDWMDGTGNEAWIARFTAVIADRPQVRGIVCGHLHRAVFTTVAGVPLMVCPASAPEVTLDLRNVDPDQPDGRPMVTADPADYALHLWDGAKLTTHIGMVAPTDPWDTLASYDEAMQRTVRQNAAERE